MPNDPKARASQATPEATPRSWLAPTFDLIALDCEITAYAPDGDTPLF
jgi:hypothetical protein